MANSFIKDYAPLHRSLSPLSEVLEWIPIPPSALNLKPQSWPSMFGPSSWPSKLSARTVLRLGSETPPKFRLWSAAKLPPICRLKTAVDTTEALSNSRNSRARVRVPTPARWHWPQPALVSQQTIIEQLWDQTPLFRHLRYSANPEKML